MLNRLARLIAAALLGATAPWAVSAAYPDKPVRLIVPWATGGSTDALARAVGQGMSATLGQQVIIENKPGAAGNLGAAAAAKATPDGYTLAIIELPHAIAPSLVSNLTYNLRRDFVPISLIGASPLMLFTHPGVAGHASVQGWLADAKAKPGALAIAHSGNGAISHLAGELLQVRTGARFNTVPYRGSAPALTDLAAGLVSAHFSTLASASALVTAGRVKPIAVTSDRRLPVMPDVPTMAEQGVPNMVIAQWWGLVAPAGTPPAVVERLRKELHAALGDVVVRERLRLLAIDKQPGTGAEFARLIDTEIRRWAKVAADAGVKTE